MRSGKLQRGTESAESGWAGGHWDSREENKSSVTLPGLSSLFRFLGILTPSISREVSGFRCDLARTRQERGQENRKPLELSSGNEALLWSFQSQNVYEII